MAIEAPVNGVGTTLASPYITSTGQTTCVITSAAATGFTNAQYHCLLTDGTNYEIILVTGLSSNTITMVRAVESYGGVQTAFTFGSGTTISVIPSVASVETLIRQIEPSIFYMTDPLYATSGQVGVGNSTADQAAYANALAAMVANGSGILHLPAAIITLSNLNPSSLVAPNSGAYSGTLPYAIRGYGSTVSVIKSTATSLATSMTVTAVSDFVTGAPVWGGFTIDGTSATSTAVGIAWSDVSQVVFQDIIIQNFTASAGKGLYFNNRVGWCERMTLVDVEVSNCTIALDFDIPVTTGYPSFDYWNVVSLYLGLNANQYGVVDEVSAGTVGGGAAGQIQHFGVTWNMVANCNNGATNTGALFWMKGFSNWSQVSWNVHAEIDGGGAVNHTSFIIANASTDVTGIGNINLLGSFQNASLNYATQLAYLTGIIVVPGSGLSTTAFAITPSGIGRQVNANPGTITLTSGSQYQNTSGVDLWLIIPITSTGVATAKMTKQFYSITVAPTNLIFAAAATGYTHSTSVLLQNNNYIRIDLVNATFGTITTEPV